MLQEWQPREVEAPLKQIFESLAPQLTSLFSHQGWQHILTEMFCILEMLCGIATEKILLTKFLETQFLAARTIAGKNLSQLLDDAFCFC